MRNLLAAIFSIVLLACPRNHRTTYGDAMRRDFVTDLAACPNAFAALLYAARMYGDLLATACDERTSVLRRDARYAIRSAARTPAFTLVVIATSALAIGANTAVFSIVRGVVLQPLPYDDAERIVVLQATTAGRPSALSLPDFADLHRETRGSLAHAAALVGYPEDHVFASGGEPRVISLASVTPQYFAVFGTPPVRGRYFEENDARPGARAIVVAEHVWRTELHAAPDVIGSTFMLEETPYRIVGVAPDAIAAPGVTLARYDAWRVFSERTTPQGPARDARFYLGIARVRPDVSVDAARADVRREAALLRSRYPRTDADDDVDVRTLLDDVVGDVRPTLFAILAAVVGVLAVACANVANLFLARAKSHERERAMRHALGASRGRILRQILTETFAYVAVGGIFGIVIAYGAVSAFVASRVSFVPRISDIHVDGWALAFTLAVVVGTTLAVGLAPAASFVGRGVSAAFGGTGRSGDMRRGARGRALLVVVEVACAIALVVVAVLVTRSYGALTARPLGFDTRDLTVAGTVTVSAARYQSDAGRSTFFVRSAERARAIPGVLDAAWAFRAPFTQVRIQRAFAIIGHPEAAANEEPVDINPVGPGFFKALAVDVRSGRVFDDRDAVGARNVVVVDEAFVQTYLRGIPPLGTRIRFSGGPPGSEPDRTIVGVVGNVRESYAVRTVPTIYEPVVQAPPFIASLVVKHAPGLDVSDAVADVFRELDPRLVRPRITPLATLMAASAARSRLTMQTLLALAFVAFVLALAGVYAVVGYGVAQRTREFGIRMALGAQPAGIVRGVIVRAMGTTLLGIVIGVGLAAVAVPTLAITLYDVAPLDPATFGGVVALVVVAALLAAFIPARRVTSLDPVVALRYD
jgi:putative ABC transport system permease protein